MGSHVAGRAERAVMGLTLTTNAELVASVLRDAEGDDVDVSSVMAAIAATRSLAVIVDDLLYALVRQARAEGRTWAEVGDVLHVSRQAAFQRFGGTASLGDVEGGTMTPLAGASDKALELLGAFVTERWEVLHAAFSSRMREAVSVELSKTVHSRMERNYGAFLEFGVPVVVVRGGLTVVDVPIALERGDLKGRVAFNVDGEVSGLLIVDPDTA
jgi:hypothetical protein